MNMQHLESARPHAIAVPDEVSCLEEASRYALLRRLAPALRHHLVGDFQPVGMIAAMMERRLQADQPDLASIRTSCASLSMQSRAAAASCIELMTWVSPQSASTIKFDAGVLECMGLLSTEMGFKGFVIVNEVSGIDMEVSSSALRSVLSAALIALSDQSASSAKLVLRAHATSESVQLLIDLQAVAGSVAQLGLAQYRLLNWRDVEVLAKAEKVKLGFSKGIAQLSFSRASVAD